jgi:hypothetical protein
VAAENSSESVSVLQVAHADDATVDWTTTHAGQMKTFSRGTRGNMFAAEENLTPLADADVEADAAANPIVTWRTKEFMWSLHSKEPQKWDARTISEQFGVKLPQVECILELFEVAPAFERLYNSGPTDWRARELLQANLDNEAKCLAGYEHVINITTLPDLQKAREMSRAPRRRVQLTDVSKAELEAMATYHGEQRNFDGEAGGSGGGGGGSNASQGYDDASASGEEAGLEQQGGSSLLSEEDSAAQDGEGGGERRHQSKLAIVSTIRPKGRCVKDIDRDS